jgi:hypothetical protein
VVPLETIDPIASTASETRVAVQIEHHSSCDADRQPFQRSSSGVSDQSFEVFRGLNFCHFLILPAHLRRWLRLLRETTSAFLVCTDFPISMRCLMCPGCSQVITFAL